MENYQTVVLQFEVDLHVNYVCAKFRVSEKNNEALCHVFKHFFLDCPYLDMGTSTIGSVPHNSLTCLFQNS